MPIVIPRTGDLDSKTTPAVPQEMQDALWAAFVTSWLDKHTDEFAGMLADPTPARV